MDVLIRRKKNIRTNRTTLTLSIPACMNHKYEFIYKTSTVKSKSNISVFIIIGYRFQGRASNIYIGADSVGAPVLEHPLTRLSTLGATPP